MQQLGRARNTVGMRPRFCIWKEHGTAAVSRALKAEAIAPGDVAVLMVIATHTHPGTLTSTISIVDVAAQIGLHQSQTSRSVRRLEQAALLARLEEKGRRWVVNPTVAVACSARREKEAMAKFQAARAAHPPAFALKGDHNRHRRMTLGKSVRSIAPETLEGIYAVPA